MITSKENSGAVLSGLAMSAPLPNLVAGDKRGSSSAYAFGKYWVLVFGRKHVGPQPNKSVLNSLISTSDFPYF